MTHLEEKIWHLVHDFCESQASHIPDQNRRFLMDMIKEMVEAKWYSEKLNHNADIYSRCFERLQQRYQRQIELLNK